MKLIVGEKSVETRIRNLSCSGIRFHAPKPLQLMSRVQIALQLPEGPKNAQSTPLSISGVVVRCDIGDVEDGVEAFDTAIFFDDLSESARLRLSRYVTSTLG